MPPLSFDSTMAQTRSGRAGETATPMLPTVPSGKPPASFFQVSPPSAERQMPPLRAARLERPGLAVHLPEAGVEDPRIVRIHAEVGGSGLVADEEDFLPGPAAVSRAKDSAVGIASPDVAERGNVDEVRIFRMDAHARDLVRALQSDVLPGLTAVGGLVHAVAVRDVAADGRLPHPRVDHVGIRLRDPDRADRSGLEVLVRHRGPVGSAVDRLPDAAARPSEVVDERLPPYARDRRHATAAERPDVAKLQPLVDFRDRDRRGPLLFLRGLLGGEEESGGNEQTESHRQTAQSLQSPLLTATQDEPRILSEELGRHFLP